VLDFAFTGFLQTSGVLLTLSGGGSPECPAFAVNLLQQLAAGKQYSFSFVVTNGITAGSSTSFLSLNTTAGLFPKVAAKSSATGVQTPPPANLCGQTTYTSCNMDIPCSCFSNDPISIMTPGFFFKRISQSTSRPGIGNRITVSVSTNVQVRELLISGLVGSETKGFGLNLAYDQIVITDLGKGETVNAFSNLGWWTQESGTIKLLKLAASTVIEGTMFVFSFNLLNPNEGQEAPTISIAAVYGLESRITTIMETPLSADNCDVEIRPMHICSPTFLERSIFQETTGPGLPTRLTVTLRSNMRLDTTSKPILLIQLPAVLFAETSTNINLEPAPTVFGSIGQYRAGNLTLQAQFPIPLDQRFVFSFRLTNNLGCMSCTDRVVFASMTAYINSQINFARMSIGAVTVMSQSFSVASLSALTRRPKENNVVTLKFQTNLEIGPIRNASITLAGMSGLNFLGSFPEVPLRDLLASDSGTSGGSASIFGGAAYTDGRDLLVFRILTGTKANVPYEISFTVTNSLKPQPSPGISIILGSQGSWRGQIPWTLVTIIDGALSVDPPGFEAKTGSQKSSSPGQKNEISVSLTSNIKTVRNTMFIKLEGLVGMSAPSGALPVQFLSSAGETTALTGTWSDTDKTFLIANPRDIIAGNGFVFTLLNFVNSKEQQVCVLKLWFFSC
jgi:hypothetical protein